MTYFSFNFYRRNQQNSRSVDRAVTIQLATYNFLCRKKNYELKRPAVVEFFRNL